MWPIKRGRNRQRLPSEAFWVLRPWWRRQSFRLAHLRRAPIILGDRACACVTHLDPRPTLPPKPEDIRERVGGMKQSRRSSFDPPDTAIDEFVEAGCTDNRKGRTGQCAHGHRLECHIPTRNVLTTGVERNAAMGICVTKVVRGCDKCQRARRRFITIPSTHNDGVQIVHGWIRN